LGIDDIHNAWLLWSDAGIGVVVSNFGKTSLSKRIIEIFNPENRNKTCTECTGKLKNKPLLGMVFLYGLKKDGKEYNDGNIVDPKTGKEYDCYIELEDQNTLKVRGYVGISIAGRTQYWKRAK
jgi:uncharacterized protein (DUF2147 family)